MLVIVPIVPIVGGWLQVHETAAAFTSSSVPSSTPRDYIELNFLFPTVHSPTAFTVGLTPTHAFILFLLSTTYTWQHWHHTLCTSHYFHIANFPQHNTCITICSMCKTKILGHCIYNRILGSCCSFTHPPTRVHQSSSSAGCKTQSGAESKNWTIIGYPLDISEISN